ncbi:MAG: hypothetical protein KGZ71_10320 [Desulfobulbaceae bacterium]|nr:hypothetical protein [Desulfobulbaceae bacterium]
MVRIALLFVIFVSFTGIALGSYDPTHCDEGDTTAWNGPITAWAVGLPSDVLGCSDTNCIVTITYYDRFVPGTGYEFQIASIQFQNCDPACKENAWRTAMWMIAMKNQVAMGIHIPNGCYQTFTYKAATCWEYSNLSPSVSQYDACGGECCVGLYEICRRIGTSGPYFEFTQLDVTTRETYNCETPCEFTDCESTMPGDWNASIPGSGTGNIFPKLGIYESVPSKNINFHPNPTDGNVIVSLDLPEKGIYKISVFDNTGYEIFKQEINTDANLNFEFELKSNTFPIGLFNVIISGINGEIINGKFIKIK